jgi:hypothetical protein
MIGATLDHFLSKSAGLPLDKLRPAWLGDLSHVRRYPGFEL